MRVVVALDAAYSDEPEYAAFTVSSEPAGASFAEHDPAPPDKVKLHNCVDPSVKVTVPVVVPAFPLTEAEYNTDAPSVTLPGPAEAEVMDGAGST